MKLDEGSDSIRSLMGSLCSILLTFLMITYAYQKMDILIARKDVDVLSTINDQHFTDDDIFSAKNGFRVAVAFTTYNNDPLWELDPTYATLRFLSHEWGPDDDGRTVE